MKVNHLRDRTFLSSDETICMDTIGSRIKSRRKALGIPQIDLAQAVDIKQGYLSEIENGKKTEIGASVLMGLCRELRVTPEFLFSGEGLQEAAERAMLESELLFMFRSIDQEQRRIIMGMMRGAFDQATGAQQPRLPGSDIPGHPDATKPH